MDDQYEALRTRYLRLRIVPAVAHRRAGSGRCDPSGEAHEALVKEAEELGSNGFVVLDLVTAYGMRRAGEPAVLRGSGRVNR